MADDEASCPIGLAHLILCLLALLVLFAIILFHFLVARTRLYAPPCPLVGRPSVHLSICRSHFTFLCFLFFDLTAPAQMV